MDSRAVNPEYPRLFAAIDAVARLNLKGFSFITQERRKSVLWRIDPEYPHMSSDPTNFSSLEMYRLFGKKFLNRMVAESDEDQKLRTVFRHAGRSYTSLSRGNRGCASFKEPAHVPIQRTSRN